MVYKEGSQIFKKEGNVVYMYKAKQRIANQVEIRENK